MRTVPATLLPEWAPQSGVMITWPHAGTDWAPMLGEVTDCYLRLAEAIALREPLLVVAPQTDAVRALLEEHLPAEAFGRVRFFACPTDDTWSRDHGFLTLGGRRPALLDFRFNGWGGKFPAARDNAINARLYASGLLEGDYRDCLDFELEGGSLETDGRGTLLTTSRCLLNANRNGGLARPEAERRLSRLLGVDRFLWLTHGALEGDDTDSHVDTLARLCPDDTILYCTAAPGDSHHDELAAMERELRAFRTREGRPYRLLPLPLPAPVYDEDGLRLPATYANYLVMNTAVLVPLYGQPEADARALRVVAEAYPGRETTGVDCRALVRQHGSLHCATMQFPAGVFRTL